MSFEGGPIKPSKKEQSPKPEDVGDVLQVLKAQLIERGLGADPTLGETIEQIKGKNTQG